MNKTYTQKQNPKLYFAAGIIFATIFFLAMYYGIHQHAWLLLPIAVVLFVKGMKVNKNPILAAITLDEDGLYNHFIKTKYQYNELSSIKLNSKYIDGYVVLKATGKKVYLNSVAISLEDQEEIQNIVQSKIKTINLK